MDTGKFIKELLILHDCVIIPGLGGFIANYKSAEINYVLKTISPPSKSILFNRNLNHNDGLLIGHISKKTGLGYKDAEINVSKYAEKIIKSTGSGNKFIIDELGFFYQDRQKKLQFQAELSTNFLIESYGLSHVYFRELYRITEKGIKPARYISLESAHLQRRKRIRRLLYTGIAASVLVAMILIPVKTGYLDYSGLRLFKGQRKPDEKQTLKTELLISQKEQVSNAGLQAIQEFSSEYHIIAGSFKEFGNARTLMVKLSDQGFKTRILVGDGGYFRVSVQSYQDKQEATLALTEIRELPGMSSAWLLKK